MTMVGVYQLDSRRITSRYWGTKGGTAFDETLEGVLVAGFISFDRHYADSNGVLAEKTQPAFGFDKSSLLADGVDTATISGVPPYTIVTWPDGEVTEVNDGLIEFSVDLVGGYTFIIDSVQHTKQEITIEALA